MEKPVNDWEHASVAGNGRQGVLCYGSAARLSFTLAHELLFQPVTPALPAPQTRTILPQLRKLLADGSFAEAAREVCDLAAREDPGYAQTRWIDPLIGAATLTFTPAPGATGYARAVDFATGVVEQRFRVGATTVICETFVARPADVVVIRVRAHGGPLTGTFALGPIAGTPERPIGTEVAAVDGDLVLTGRFDDAERPGYTVACRLRRSEDTLVVVARTAPGLRTPAEALDELPAASVEQLLRAHVGVHGDLFHRTRLDLGGDRAQRLFDAGRYLIISSTGARPPTLQGVWSGTYSPPWRSGWTIDGNLQTALLAVHSTGTPELMPPLFDLLDTLLDDFRENARRLYGLPGLLAPAHLGTHGRHNHFGPVWCLTFWTAGVAWLGRLYLDHWQHTRDRAFLRDRAWPFLTEAADFYLGFAEIVDGRARFSPSYSPENHPANTGSQACVDATMDVATVRDLLRGLLTAAAELGVDDPREPRWRELLGALPPYRIAASGELAEWLDPRLDDNHEHRHCSHLYPFFYAGDPVFDDPALRAAAIQAVRNRLRWWLSEASDEMGYGLALLGVAAARLGLAEEAYAALDRIADRYWRPNLAPTHNRDHIFNVDLAGGLPALIVAMLLRSRDVGPDGIAGLDLLPALPSAWPHGQARGLVARGAVTVDLDWSPDHVEAVLTSRFPRTVEVTLPDGATTTLHLTPARPERLVRRR